MFLLYMLSQGPYISIHFHERCVLMQVFCGLTAIALEATRIVITYRLCVKTNSCVFNCKPDNENRNPENL